jgi:hypothetical protein
MSKEDIKDVHHFLKPFPEDVKEVALWLREFIWDLYPEANELIYDNYNALAIGFSPTDKAGDVFCSIAVYSKHVNFGFNRGSEIADPQKILNGKGSLYRHLTIREKSDLPATYIKTLLKDAYRNAVSKLKEKPESLQGKTIIKSISAKQRRPK